MPARSKILVGSHRQAAQFQPKKPSEKKSVINKPRISELVQCGRQSHLWRVLNGLRITRREFEGDEQGLKKAEKVVRDSQKSGFESRG